MTYLLIHSMAHHVMHGIARFSGLDLGSLSEVIFPTDRAFAAHSARHDGRPRKHFIHVARPEQCIPPLSRRTSRVALWLWYALRPSRRRLSRLHHDPRNILHCRKSAAIARGTGWRAGHRCGIPIKPHFAASSKLFRTSDLRASRPRQRNAIGRGNRPMHRPVAWDGSAPQLRGHFFTFLRQRALR